MSYLPDAVADFRQLCISTDLKAQQRAEISGKEDNEPGLLFNYNLLFNLFQFKEGLKISDKDLAAQDYNDFMSKVLDDYQQHKKVWYK